MANIQIHEKRLWQNRVLRRLPLFIRKKRLPYPHVFFHVRFFVSLLVQPLLNLCLCFSLLLYSDGRRCIIFKNGEGSYQCIYMDTTKTDLLWPEEGFAAATVSWMRLLDACRRETLEAMKSVEIALPTIHS